MKIITTLLITVIVGIVLVVGFAYSGLYNVSATSPHSGLANWLMSTTMHASIDRRAKDIEVPDLDDEALQLAGINDFDAMCVACHGAPGKDPDAMGQGLNPSAPDLKEAAGHNTAAELFWVTKHGIKMTGMPAWGASHDDEALWPVVAFMTLLPNIDADTYQTMLASAKGSGHHDTKEQGHGDTESGANEKIQPHKHNHAGADH